MTSRGRVRIHVLQFAPVRQWQLTLLSGQAVDNMYAFVCSETICICVRWGCDEASSRHAAGLVRALWCVLGIRTGFVPNRGRLLPACMLAHEL